ncbi:intracellular serine protease [Fictibacillus macauensis ZFHKF-1]|uniref:Intracellular serine protease n=1 Tax=Fictibacillus macauensis ZFHKF-1 TaxID=1196324 RepID=I8AKI3_9BACL|nr:S8 family peptidase [Fictibacillus macauensis]EIT86357.1 intracellular serine protease [Fictibacillus macauensis ZFHKF-1]
MRNVRLIPFALEEVMPELDEMIPYGVQMMNAPAMWQEDAKGTDIVVAVLDTGCDGTHPNLKDRIIGGRSFIGGDPSDYSDAHYHGTHVAGTIAASFSAKGVTGVAPEAKLLILRVLDEQGSGSYEGINEAIRYAISWRGDKGERVRVISMSLGGPEDDPNMHEAIKTAVEEGIVVVCAAGNEGDSNEKSDEQSYPGYYKEVVQVGAIDEQKKLASFSNTNDEIDVVAPGVNIISTFPGGKYAKLSGTSMATPHVSGAIALLIQKEEKEFERGLTEPEVYAQLCKNTTTICLSKRGEGNGLVYLDSESRKACQRQTQSVTSMQ